MANYILNGNFGSGTLTPWNNVQAHVPVVITPEGTGYFALFQPGSQIHQSTAAHIPGKLRFSMRIKVNGGSNEVVGNVQILISHQASHAPPAFEAYVVREYSNWQTAQIDLDYGDEPLLVNLWIIVQPSAVGDVSITDVVLDDSAKSHALASMKKLR